MTPDPAGMAAADPANPQSWNRYAYVMNNPLNATDPFGLYCYFGDGPSFSTGERDMQHECGRCNPITDASCSGDGLSHDDPAGTPDSVLGESIAQNTATAEASYASWAYAMEKTGGEYVGANGVRVAIGWTMYGGVNGVNESNGEIIDAAGLAELIGSPSAGFMGGGGMGLSGAPKCLNGGNVCQSPIDKLNLMEMGKANYRDALPICSTHVTIDNSTGQMQSHTDLFNPQGSLPVSPGANIPLLPFHLMFDALPDAIYRTTGRYILPAGRNNCQ